MNLGRGGRLSLQNPLLTEMESLEQKSPMVSESTDSTDVGLDWLNLAFDINLDLTDFDSDLWSSSPKGGERVPGVAYQELFASLPFGGTHITVCLNLVRFRCYVRFNPSTALFGASRQLVSGDKAWLVVERVLDYLQPNVFGEFDCLSEGGEIRRSSDWIEKVWLTRVDCARNLFIDDPEQFKKLAESSVGKHNPMKNSYSKTGGTWGLVHKTKQEGQDRIYDKSLELSQHIREEELGQVEPNWFRFETQLQRDRLVRYQMTRLSELNQERVWVALERRFAATGWGVAIRGKGDFALASESLTATEKMSLLGFISMNRLGLQDEVSPGRQRKYSQMMLALGLTFDDPVGFGPLRGVVDIRQGKIVDRIKGGGSNDPEK